MNAQLIAIRLVGFIGPPLLICLFIGSVAPKISALPHTHLNHIVEQPIGLETRKVAAEPMAEASPSPRPTISDRRPTPAPSPSNIPPGRVPCVHPVEPLPAADRSNPTVDLRSTDLTSPDLTSQDPPRPPSRTDQEDKNTLLQNQNAPSPHRNIPRATISTSPPPEQTDRQNIKPPSIIQQGI
ncbi:hypothetical protein CKAH01_07639 [Colletotrichum kahawae]|uniref:Uncharacterized protein n=1 Tax=Colletotrichum kahawae TaxID=34407 RepID=A0AAE0D1E5_COLKA|nr:hypothetical protein CKAH01_07639 [Colletotrichum kahawae]